MYDTPTFGWRVAKYIEYAHNLNMELFRTSNRLVIFQCGVSLSRPRVCEAQPGRIVEYIRESKMKRFVLFLLCAVFISVSTRAHNIEWYVDGNVYTTTTCQAGDNITPPTPPAKTGYTFQGWSTYYTPIEYLESINSSYQYINSGIIPTRNTGIKIIFSSSNTESNNPLFGSRAAYNDKSFDAWIYGASACRIDIGSTQKFFGVLSSNTKYTLEIKDGKISLENGYIYDYVPEYYSNYPIYIFNINEGNTPRQSDNYTARIYEVIIYEDENIIQHLVPALDDNETPCMFDKVENKFYYNAGTGQFIAGPVLTE